jgi:prophage tail gpP-like protein
MKEPDEFAIQRRIRVKIMRNWRKKNLTKPYEEMKREFSMALMKMKNWKVFDLD